MSLGKDQMTPYEPEKHWGLYNENRTPKLAMKKETYKK